MEKIKYILKERNNEIELPETLGFGKVFTDHLFMMDYTPAKGWHSPVIKPIDQMEMHPATMFIHYGQAVFEGMKAFKQENGDIVLFRPDKHFERINNSSRRICIHEIDIDFVIEELKEIILIDKDWIK